MIIRIPFQGFYESELVERLGVELDMIECHQEAEGQEVDWPKTFLKTAKEYAELWAMEVELNAEFEALASPREFNFDTDSLFLKFSTKALAEVRKRVEDRLGEFRVFVMDNCSDRPGFHSFLPNDFREWPEEWNELHYQVALMFLEDGEELEETIIENMACNGGFQIEYR